jgi:AraC-like DNA-binding protein
MLENFTYTNLSLNGLLHAFSNHYNVKIKVNSLTLPQKVGHVSMQGLTLPGDIDVLFTEYQYDCDINILHTAEKEQKLALWISLSEGDDQEFSIKLNSSSNTLVTSGKFQSKAYLLNSIFPFTYLRRKGTKGKTIVIFIPKYLIESFGENNTNEMLLGKYYALQTKGLSLIKLSQEEINIVNNFFKKWKENQNIIALATYSFQLLEWYFKKLIDFLKDETDVEKLSEQEAKDLYAMQMMLDSSLHLAKPDFLQFEKKHNTSFMKLKQLFVKMYGKTLYDYFNEQKMKAAREILISTDKNIAEIAYEFGFANPSNFSAAFKRNFKSSPNECRQQLKLTEI